MIRPLQSERLTELASFQLTRETMEVSEFELFRLAHAVWYGESPDLQFLDKQFDDYLLGGNLPFYVRHYCRKFIEDHPETVKNARLQEKRIRWIQRLTTGLIIGFVAGALILS